MYEIDARGLSCPEPVLLTAEAIKEHGSETVKVLVDEPHTRKNVEKFVRSQKLEVSVKELGSEFEIIIEPK